MREILINEPVPFAERLHLFPGRHLGEEEFDRMQVYADQRLAPLLAGHYAGIVQGLQVKLGPAGGGSEGFTVSPGLAVAGNGSTLGLYYPLRQTWKTLIEDYVKESGVTDATGVYYLTLRRTRRRVDADANVDPCQRAEFDPTRDSRLVVVGSLGLKRLSISAAAVSTASRETLENWVAANHVDAEFLNGMNNAVPLGLLAIRLSGGNYEVPWFSETAGRYMAERDSGFVVLLHQVQDAFRRILLQARGSGTPLPDFLAANLRLDFLPAAGELPIDLLQNPASATPSTIWLPPHLGIDMVVVPEESVTELIERHLSRRVVDLRVPAGDQLRLMVAVNEPDYRPNLLDFPQTDAQLESDLFRYYMRSYDAWRDWMKQFDGLYFLAEGEVLTPATIKALDLPKPIAPPQTAQQVFTAVIDEARKELPPVNGGVPYPYSNGVPAPPPFFTSWLVNNAPPPVPVPTEDGLVIRYSVAVEDMEELDNEIRAIRARLEKTRDYLMLQRQQLDSQTVSLASLAGGVAGDGSGLQVARWLPFTQFVGVKASPAAAEARVDNPGLRASELSIAADVGSTFFQPSIALPKLQTSLQTSLSQTFFTSVLQQAPQKVSAVQYTLNANRINKILDLPKQALTKPAFDSKAQRFGVLEHVLPEIQEYTKAYRGMRELISTLDGMFDTADAKSLKGQLEGFGKPVPPETLAEQDKKDAGATPDAQRQNSIQARYQALFDAGQILTKQIACVEGRYGRIESQLTGKLRERIRSEANIEKLAATIEQATELLANLDKPRIERLGDYGVAQRLIDDDWRKVYQTNEERTRILTKGVRGLFYVRLRQTPISQPLADPLLLRHGTSADIVPGCDNVEDPQLPDQLDEFFDAVREVPMTDWVALKDLKPQLPPAPRLTYLSKLRSVRFKSRPAQRVAPAQGNKLQARLLTISVQNQSVLQHWSNMILPELNGSQKLFQVDTAAVLSLEDILSGTQGQLRRSGQQLRDRLEQCVACLLNNLNELPPSIRLQWAQQAEDDAIDVQHVNSWPGLERAERDDFNATRTVAELAAWWFRQLDSQASGNSLSAMRNMIRAVLIFAALGDPAEILHGEVHVPPRRLLAGEPLRLKLNRAAAPGTILQLLDTQQRRVALLTIEDHDAAGATAHITKVDRSDVMINTQFKVVATKMTKMLM